MNEQQALKELLDYLKRLTVAVEDIAESLKVGLQRADAFDAANEGDEG